MRLRLIPEDTKLDFLGWRKLSLAVSTLAVVLSLGAVAVFGLNFGIDFRGGTLLEARFKGAADIGHVRAVAGGLSLGDVAVQEFGRPSDVLIRIERQAGGGDEQVAAVELLRAALIADNPEVEIRRVEVVGPKVSRELVQRGFLAIGLAVMARAVLHLVSL